MSAKKTQRLGEISPVTEKLSEQALIDELAAFDRYECISVELDRSGGAPSPPTPFLIRLKWSG